MLDDDIRTNDGNTEWEPESEHGDLVCPIASSEFTSLEPIGKIRKQTDAEVVSSNPVYCKKHQFLINLPSLIFPNALD